MDNRINIKLKDTELLVQEALDFAYSDNAGAVVSFVGTVRNQTKDKKVLRLEFEAYEPMAISEMKKIAQTAMKKWPIAKIAIHHRVGTLAIGGIAVVITVSCPHRKAAYAASQFAIDTLKETVPIWKKEFFEDGAVWVAAHP